MAASLQASFAITNEMEKEKLWQVQKKFGISGVMNWKLWTKCWWVNMFLSISTQIWLQS